MNKTPIILVLVVILCVVLSSSFFVVDEVHMAVVLQFGRPIKTENKAGLKLKTPFIQDVIYFDKRILEWDGQANKIPTRDKKFIWVDTTARWRIVDPLKYYQTVRDESGAQTKLDNILDGITRDVISNSEIKEVVRSSNRKLGYSEEFFTQAEIMQQHRGYKKKTTALAVVKYKDQGAVYNLISDKNLIDILSAANPDVRILEEHYQKQGKQIKKPVKDEQGKEPVKDEQGKEPVKDSQQGKEPVKDSQGKELIKQKTQKEIKGRAEITTEILKRSKKDVENLGIEIIDVLIKRVNYTEDVQRKVFDRMISERQKVAEQYRSEGEGKKAMILGDMEMELKQIRSLSYLRAQTIKGAADAVATEIYAKTYQEDPEFYEFYKALQNYRETIDHKTYFLFSTNNAYLKFLKNPKIKKYRKISLPNKASEIPKHQDTTKQAAVPDKDDATKQVIVPAKDDATKQVIVPAKDDATKQLPPDQEQ